MELVIVTTDKLMRVPVVRIQVETEQGYYTILPEHAPLLLALKAGSTVRYTPAQGSEVDLTIGRAGLLQVDRHVCHVCYSAPSGE